MYAHIAELAQDLNLNNSNEGSDTDLVTVDCNSFKQALKVARKAIKYLESKGYKETGQDNGNQRQGAQYTDDESNHFTVAVCWGREVHIRQY